VHERTSLRPALALGLAMFLPAFGTHGLNAGRGDLAAALDLPAGDERVRVAMAIFALAGALAYLVVGAVGDRIGLRRTLVGGVVGFLAAHLLLLVQRPLAAALGCPPWWLFLGGRIAAGLAGGAITVSANALGGALYVAAQRGRALSLVWLGVPLALVVGVPLPLLLGGAWRELPERIAPWCGEPYTAVALLAALLAAAFVLRAVPDAPPAPAAASGATPTAAPSPLPRLADSWWIYATSLLMPLGVFPLIVSADAWTESAYGFDRPARAGLLFLLGAASVAGGLGSSLVADRLGRRRTLLASLASFALLAALLPFSGAAAYVALAALLGLVSTVRQGPFQALASFVADQRGRGRFSARILVASQLGISGGQFLGDRLLSHAGGAAKLSLVPIAAVTVGCTVAALLLAWRLREPAPEPAPRVAAGGGAAA